jgi:aryl-alcohol dehydrogenase-like predicted oxidoreductase
VVPPAVQASRLGRDVIDVYFLHYPHETGVPLEETWGALAELVDQGLVKAIGLANYRVEDVKRCRAQRPVDVVQDGLSLVDHLDNWFSPSAAQATETPATTAQQAA